mgnify:CR=1 FL=1
MGKAGFALAELYREEGHVREAAVEYANALASEPGNALWRARLGTLLLETGATTEAAAELARAAAALDTEVGAFIGLPSLPAAFTMAGGLTASRSHTSCAMYWKWQTYLPVSRSTETSESV